MEIPESIIRGILIRAGMSPEYRGFRYFVCAITMFLDDPFPGREMMTKVYPAVAAEMNTTPSRVERCMRNAVRIAWDNQRFRRDRVLSRLITHKMTNSQLIACLVTHLRTQAEMQEPYDIHAPLILMPDGDAEPDE